LAFHYKYEIDIQHFSSSEIEVSVIKSSGELLV
jgi:hypothetical protein